MAQVFNRGIGANATMRWSPTGPRPLRIVRIRAKHIAQEELNQMLLNADFAPLKDKEFPFYYGDT